MPAVFMFEKSCRSLDVSKPISLQPAHLSPVLLTLLEQVQCVRYGNVMVCKHEYEFGCHDFSINIVQFDHEFDSFNSN